MVIERGMAVELFRREGGRVADGFYTPEAEIVQNYSGEIGALYCIYRFLDRCV